MRSVFVAVIVAASLATAIATPFAVPANDTRWDISPRPTSERRLERLHGIGCLPGADGLVVNHGVRVEFIFQGTQLRLFGIPPPRDTQILMDDAPLADSKYLGGQAACVPFAEWPQLAPQERHNLTILTSVSNRPNEMAFLIANATGTAPDTKSSSRSSTQSTLPTASPSTSASSPAGSAQSDHGNSQSSPSQASPRPGLLIAAVLVPLVAFLLIGFGAYFYVRRRRQRQILSAPTVIQSASFKGMKETQFVMVTTRPDTPGVVKV